MRRGTTRVISLAFSLAIAIFVSPRLTTTANAQIVGASITGTVRDTSGASVPQAAVTVRNLETGAVRKVESDGEGHYAAPSVPVGRYEVTVEKEGFSTASRSGVNLVIGQTAVVDV